MYFKDGGGQSTEVELALLTKEPRARISTLQKNYEMGFRALCSKKVFNSN